MRHTILAAGLAAIAVIVFSGAPTGSALAKSDAEIKAQLEECKKLADPKAKDECVKKVGKGAETSSEAKGKKAAETTDSKGKKKSGSN